MSQSKAAKHRRAFSAPPRIPTVEEAAAAPFGISMQVFEPLDGGGHWCKAIGDTWFKTQAERDAKFDEVKADCLLTYRYGCKDFKFVSCVLEYGEIRFENDEHQPSVEIATTDEKANSHNRKAA